ncbi:ComEA family DNA-binding protein [Phytoactinopolyspora mesophila]|uniref:LPXTG cell wall anchor domain-containing protein n=1 Tax=Phytoactinopolyspora mesophila TaxID=2650750 RepID=A0A7K3M2E6_9ACTN|nr:helix-hairpin-helix domain-containing protein [Phytoactinopolyspora mesophila]NDL57465.1 LPXTG cell wall anchor domain-containing protein [Phytoactinopolyspora mesophila]
MRKIIMAAPAALALVLGGTAAASADPGDRGPSADIVCEDGAATIVVEGLDDAERWQIVTVGGDDAGISVLSDEDGATSVSVEPGEYELAWWVDVDLPYDTLPIEVSPCDEDVAQLCVDVNTADEEELQRLKHIGPDRAAQIIELRPFTSIDDLGRVSGLAAGGERLKELVAGGGDFLPLCPFEDDGTGKPTEDDDEEDGLPEALPDTGAGMALLALAGVGAIGAAGGLSLLRRRLN